MEATTVRPGLVVGRAHHHGSMSIPELAVHALAQLPETVRLELGPTPDRAMLDLTARGYAIRGRVAFDRGHGTDSVRFITADGLIDAAALLPATLGELVERIGSGVPSTIGDSSDSVLSGHRVVILTNYPAHYRLPLFDRMSARLSKAGAHLHVMFLADRSEVATLAHGFADDVRPRDGSEPAGSGGRPRAAGTGALERDIAPPLADDRRCRRLLTVCRRPRSTDRSGDRRLVRSVERRDRRNAHSSAGVA